MWLVYVLNEHDADRIWIYSILILFYSKMICVAKVNGSATVDRLCVVRIQLLIIHQYFRQFRQMWSHLVDYHGLLHWPRHKHCRKHHPRHQQLKQTAHHQQLRRRKLIYQQRPNHCHRQHFKSHQNRIHHQPPQRRCQQ